MNIYDREIIRGYEAIKRLAVCACREKDYMSSIEWVKHASTVANQLNWQFNDDEINSLMDDLSHQVVTHIKQQFTPKKNKVVFYDQYGKSFILALQYINGLISAGYDVLYILSDYVNANLSTFIVDDLRLMNNVSVAVVPLEWDIKQRAEYIYHLTVDYAPEKLFLHVKMFSVFNIVLPSLPETITKYYIDLQDHAWWVKNTNLDYVIPYRDWGATIDIEKRGFKESQVLKLPYYPIINKRVFQGFPLEAQGKVVILSGGEYYKTVDWENTYWNLVVKVLSENPDAILLFAGKGDNEAIDQAIKHLAKGNDVSKRLIPIGFRTDINEVFAHCDIYMGTSPMSGGLMCQYAAYYGKPILQYYRPDMASNNETEQVLDYNGDLKISFTDKEAFLQEAKRLIGDESYRNLKGREIQETMIRKEQFDELIKITIDDNHTYVKIHKQRIQYETFIKWWFYLEHSAILECRKYLSSLLKSKKYLIMPMSSVLDRINSI